MLSNALISSANLSFHIHTHSTREVSVQALTFYKWCKMVNRFPVCLAPATNPGLDTWPKQQGSCSLNWYLNTGSEKFLLLQCQENKNMKLLMATFSNKLRKPVTEGSEHGNMRPRGRQEGAKPREKGSSVPHLSLALFCKTNCSKWWLVLWTTARQWEQTGCSAHGAQIERKC